MARAVSRLVRQVQGVPVPSWRSVLRGWFICGTALPWVRPKHHDWVQQSMTGLAGPVLQCTRCPKRWGF
jgi:hypothetical protein